MFPLPKSKLDHLPKDMNSVFVIISRWNSIKHLFVYMCVHACSQAFWSEQKGNRYDGKTFRHGSSALPRCFSYACENVWVILAFIQESIAIFYLQIQTFNKQHRIHKATCTTTPKKSCAPYVTLWILTYWDQQLCLISVRYSTMTFKVIYIFMLKS